MCILGLALHASPAIPFFCFHNRDEYFSRPVTPLQRVGDVVLARDLRGGGTWMGLNTRLGICVALTNVREKAEPKTSAAASSRGQFVLDVLEGRSLSRECLRTACDGDGTTSLTTTLAGFNMTVSFLSTAATSYPESPADTYFVSNRRSLPLRKSHSATKEEDSSVVFIHRIPHGVHALSNSTLDDECWLKVKWVRDRLSDMMSPAAALSASPAHSIPPEDETIHLARALEAAANIVTRDASLLEYPGYGDFHCQKDTSWSPLPHDLELYLQNHVFLKPIDRGIYGTRSTTVVVQIGCTAVYYCYCTWDTSSSLPSSNDATRDSRAALESSSGVPLSRSSEQESDADAAVETTSRGANSRSEGAFPSPGVAEVEEEDNFAGQSAAQPSTSITVSAEVDLPASRSSSTEFQTLRVGTIAWTVARIPCSTR